MSETLDPALSGLTDCGCCAGITAETPVALRNREGLDQILYRIGTHGQFKRTMLAALSEASHLRLQGLTTRANDDFSIALLDAWAATADVLTFYQERLANESYLRTATEHGSVLKLARLIGYELKPGVAASAWLAFTIETAPGAPDKATIPLGAKVQSIPGQDEKPQTFETIEAIEARAEWNAMRPQVTAKRAIQAGDTYLHLRGTATQLQPGDAILIVGDERDQFPVPPAGKERWAIRILTSVTPNPDKKWTQVTWEEPLGTSPAERNVQVYAFRQRAALFGHNAPFPNLVFAVNGKPIGSWAGFEVTSSQIELDASYPKVVPGGWIALVAPPSARSKGGFVELYKALKVSFPSLAMFAISGKSTRVAPDISDPLDAKKFDRRETLVFAQSEQLEVADPPLTTHADEAPSKPSTLEKNTLVPVEGTRITLDRQVAEFAKGRTLIITGKRSHAKVATAEKDDETVSELAVIESSEGNPTKIVLAGKGLQNIYDRATVTIAGNVARATHGETVEEVAGSGDATQAFQKLTLRQPPLTCLRAAPPSLIASTLEVRVDDLLWHKASSLYQHKPNERIYVERLGDEGKTTVHFGDGLTGARLPSGQENVRLKYRKGSGLEGLVKARQLTQLLTRPLGVKEVTNPLPPEGADEPELLSDARQNAPFTVLTLERVVSLQDYEDFARAYPGIGKALATWTWNGRARGVFLTVAGPQAALVGTGPDSVGSDLLDALRAAGDPFVPIRVETYRPAFFHVTGTVTVHPDYEQEKVLAASREALQARFSFAARQFGQPVMLSEVIGVLHSVAGVFAVDVDHLQRTDITERTNPAPRLLAEFPGGGADLNVKSAELLLLASGKLEEVKAAS